MPGSSINFYLQDARSNMHAVRPAPIYTDANPSLGQNVHISTNCYHGYHNLKRSDTNHVDTDCEMLEASVPVSPSHTSRKRSADSRDYPQSKRHRDDDSSMCSLVGTRSSPSHSASALNANIPTVYILNVVYRFVIRL